MIESGKYKKVPGGNDMDGDGKGDYYGFLIPMNDLIR